jgi:type II secretory pathway pseudopilin PulG
MNKHSRGFTVIELIVIVLLLAGASIMFFIQKNNVEVAARDNERKTAINAMYYSLEEVFYKANGFYPQTINETNLPSVDPALFTDPNGVKIGAAGSNYRYEPLNCTNDQCKSYTLRTTLQNEADFVKDSKNK